MVRKMNQLAIRMALATAALVCFAAGAAGQTGTLVTGTFKGPTAQTCAALALRTQTVGGTAMCGELVFTPYDSAGRRVVRLIYGGVTYFPQAVKVWIRASDNVLMSYDPVAGTVSAGVRLIPNANATPSGTVYRLEARLYESNDGFLPEAKWLEQKTVPDQASVDWGTLAPAGITALSYTGYSTVQDEAASLAARNTINFTGAGVACTDNAGNTRTDCTITGVAGAAYATVQEEGAALTQRATVNFIGSAITCVDNAGLTKTDCTVTGGGAGSQHQVNAVNLTANDPVNFQNAGVLTWSNPSAGNVQVALGIVPIANGGLNNSAAPSADGQIPIWNAAQAKYVPGDPLVSGFTAHDAAAASTNPVLAGCYANAAAPADVSADVDAVREWCLRNGSQVVNLASGGTLVTLGQKTAPNSLPVIIASDQGAVPVSIAGNQAVNLAQVGG
ncbi:MAG: hypothetical protein ACRD3I_03900, partial [Terriglobales bacterium]